MINHIEDKNRDRKEFNENILVSQLRVVEDIKVIPRSTMIKGLSLSNEGVGAEWRGKTKSQFKTAPEEIAPKANVIIAKVVGIRLESEAMLEGVKFCGFKKVK